MTSTGVLRKQHQEEFERTTMFDIPGAPRRGAYLIRCTECATTDKISMPANIRALPPDVVAKRFSTRGWSTTKGRRSRDLCPHCQKKDAPMKASAAAPPPALTVVPAAAAAEAPAPALPAPAPPAAPAAPKTMTREEKRVIFAKLNDVYLDEKSGYSEGWGDGRVAHDLGVALEWVRLIREDSFGPDSSSEEIRGLVEQAREVLKEIRSHMSRVDSTHSGVDNLLAHLKKLEAQQPALLIQATRIEGHIARIARQVGL